MAGTVEAWFRWLLHELTTELITRVTDGAVVAPDEISYEYSMRVGHLAQVDAVAALQEAASEVEPIRADALRSAKLGASLRGKLLSAKSRPVSVGSGVLLVSGQRTQCEVDTALAYYDLAHPCTDFVKRILPVVPPDFDSEMAIYEFIGERLNDTQLAARARLLKAAAAVLTPLPRTL